MFADRVSGHRQPVRVRVAAGDGGKEAAGGREIQAEDSVQREDRHLPVTTLVPSLGPSLLPSPPSPHHHHRRRRRSFRSFLTITTVVGVRIIKKKKIVVIIILHVFNYIITIA